MIEIVDDGRVRTITFQRPEAKNAMNTEMWDGTTEAFLAAADDPGVAVVVLTGSEDSFSAGQDLIEMAQLATGNGPEQYGFAGLCRTLIDFPKPLILAVNGLGLGFGTTILGFPTSSSPQRTPVSSARSLRSGSLPSSSSMTFPASSAVKMQAGR